jgi:CheY-like chemotaxis protein
VSLAKKNRYDLIFMDHMMPGMDGIEAAAAIRELNGSHGAEYYQKLPIVALTASAVSGMKEMFLGKNFDDYLSKPIEIVKLDEMVSRWIPKEKQIKSEVKISRKKFEGDSGLTIPGIDVAKGINMTGGTVDGYRQVLALFRKDVIERMPYLASAPVEGGLVVFTTHVHAVKSAAGTIGAEALSKEAAELEALSLAAAKNIGKAGDIGVIKEKLPGFYEHLKETVEEIRKTLETNNEEQQDDTEKMDGDSFLLCREQFLTLKTALEKKDIETIDNIIALLEKAKMDAKIKEHLDAISNAVLLSKFESALDVVNVLLEADK